MRRRGKGKECPVWTLTPALSAERGRNMAT